MVYLSEVPYSRSRISRKRHNYLVYGQVPTGALHHGRMDVLVIDTNVRFQLPRTVSDVSSIDTMVNASAGDGGTWSRITNKTSVNPRTAGTLDVRWMSTEIKHVKAGVSDKLRRIEY